MPLFNEDDDAMFVQNTPAIQSDTGEVAIDIEELPRITEHKRIAPDSIEIKTPKSAGNMEKGAWANFGRGVFSNVEGFVNGGAESVRYYLGQVAINASRPVFGGKMAQAFSDKNLGDVLAMEETKIKLQKKYDEYTTSLQESGYDPEGFAFGAGAAVGQVGAQVGLSLANPALGTASIAGMALDEAGRKMAQYEEAGFDNFTAFARGSTSGILSFYTDKFSGDILTRAIEPMAVKTFKFYVAKGLTGALGEGLSEGAEDSLNQLIDVHVGRVQEKYSLGQTLTAGAMGVIGGGVAGVSHAAIARNRAYTAQEEVERGVLADMGIPWNDRIDQERAANTDNILVQQSINMLEARRQNVRLSPEVDEEINARYDAMRGADVTSNGLTQEDIERVANRKRDFDAIVDSVTATMPQYTTNEAGEKVIRSDGFSETAPEVAMKVKSLDSEITTKLNAIAALERKGDPVAGKLKANLDKQLKDMGLLQEQAAELQRLAVESRQDSDVTLDATMTASVKHMDDALDRTAKAMSETMRAIEMAEIDKQLDLNDKLEDLTEQYAELEQERKDILNGVAKPEGRIITTAAKIREFRLKSARDTLRNIAATRRVTKQEIAGTYNAVKRAIKSTKLPRDVKNGLITKYAKANTYEELFEVYPAIQTAIDEALRVEQRKRAMRDIERSIFQLMRGKLGQDRAFGEALNQARRGEPTRPIAPHLDSFLNSVRYIYSNDALANDYVITLAEQLMKYRAESKQFLAEIVREREDKLANLLALTKKGAKGLKKQLPKGQLYESDPLIQTPGDGLLRAGKFSATLLRDFTLIGEDIKRAFDIHAPFFSKHMAIAKAKEDLRDVRRAAMPGKTDDQIDDILHADATQSADDPIFTRMVKSPDPKEPDMNVSVRYTPSQIRSLWSMTRNNEARSEFVKSGTVSEETIDEVEAWMNAPENARHKALAEGNMKLLERYAQRIQAMYADAFPLAYFSPIENYFMTARMYLADTEDSFMPSLSAPTEEGANRKALFATPKNLKGRTGSEKYRFVIPADTDSMTRYIDSMEHFLAFGKYVNDLRAYLNEAETTLDVAYGEGFTQSMRDRVDVLESAQAIRNMAYGGKGLSKMIKNTASAVVRGVTQLVKQPVGVFTANIDRSRLGTSYAAAIEGIIDPKNADPIMRVIVKLKSIDPRYCDLSMFSPIITEYADTENTPKKQRRAHFWNRLLSIAPREGDRIAYYTVAHAKASELIDNGMNQDDAIAEGIREAEASQTTMNPARTPAFVAGIKRTSPVVANALKLQTTVLQMLDRNMMQMDKVSKYWATGNKKKAIAELADVLERWNFWVPFSYMVASGSVSIGEILKKTLTGPAGDVQVVGQIMDAVLTNNVISAINAVQVGGGDDEEGDKKEKIKTPYQNGQDLVSSAMDKARQNFMKSWKAFQTPDEDANEETEKDIIRGLMYAAEGASWIGAVAHGVQYPEFAKIIGNVYDNEKARMDMDVGYYAPLITSIMGYSSKKVEDLRKQLEEEKGGGEE